MRKFCFLVAAAAATIAPAIANAQEAGHFYMREILLPLKRQAASNPAPQPDPEPVAAWKTGLFSIARTATSCTSSITVSRTVSCALPNGTAVDEGQCTAAKPAASQQFACSEQTVLSEEWESRGSYPSQRYSGTTINLTGPIALTIETAKSQAEAWCNGKKQASGTCILASFDYRASDQSGIYRAWVATGTGGSSTSPAVPSGYTRSPVLLQKRFSTKYAISASAAEFSNCTGSSYFVCQ